MYELAFAVFGFLLGLVPPWFSRKRRLKTHWCAIRAEMSQCKDNAATLLQDKIQSPLYRLPLIAYQTSYPVLLADGAVAESEVSILGKFFSTVQDINRGLDNAAALFMSGGVMDNKLESEHDRNKLKARNLLDQENSNPSLYEQAKILVDRKIALKWWQYGKHA